MLIFLQNTCICNKLFEMTWENCMVIAIQIWTIFDLVPIIKPYTVQQHVQFDCIYKWICFSSSRHEIHFRRSMQSPALLEFTIWDFILDLKRWRRHSKGISSIGTYNIRLIPNLKIKKWGLGSLIHEKHRPNSYGVTLMNYYINNL